MFDIGFSELALIAVVALVVLGPERLPKAARFAGLWVRRARAQWDSVKQELERELEAEELKRSLQDVQASLREAEGQLRSTQQHVEQEAQQLHEAVSRDIDIRSAAQADVLVTPTNPVDAPVIDPLAAPAPASQPTHPPSPPLAHGPALVPPPSQAPVPGPRLTLVPGPGQRPSAAKPESDREPRS
ncbi:Sec-independent protein translocase protein TatB [Xanthomonas maliensis]|uniref:Sec-independent protein translocase protein TatB n=2 Tax=Xanthomonas maliensis TaxID=1321368 RepID=UPI0012645BB4|nr:Sec-independent protein translocase protein TatB [Xanthomonas maliensis]KAB7768439.1 twin-arginine translocase subunit TatB [Xanthomonas maliensis]